MIVSAHACTQGGVYHVYFDTSDTVDVWGVASRGVSRPRVEAATRVCDPSAQHRLQTRRLNYAPVRLQRHGPWVACDVNVACRVDRVCLSVVEVARGHIMNGTR